MSIDPGRLTLPLLLAVAALMGSGPLQRAQTASLESRVAALEEAQQRIETQLQQLRTGLDSSLEPVRVRLADQGEEMRSMEARMVALEEKLNLTNEGIARLSEQISGLQGGGGRAGGAAGRPMPTPQRPAGVPAPRVARQPATSAEAGEAETLYSSAYTDFLAGEYGLAVTGFQEFLRRFPDSEQADNAAFWIAESLYAQQQYGAARAAFLQIRRDYPDAETVPDALFKAARCLIDTGAPAEAVFELIELVRTHPVSESARIACLQLEKLGAEKPPECPAS